MTGSLQIKNGKYFAVLNFRDQSGKRVQRWFSLGLDVKGNKRRAETMLNELLVQYQGIENIEPMNTLLSRHIASWIEMNRPNIAVTTYNQYVNILNLHIAPYFDPRKITVSSVTAGDLEDYYAFKIANGLNPNTVIKHHAIIRSALQWAVKHRYIRENAADFANRPEHVKYHGPQPYSVEEVAQLLQATQHEPIAVPIFLACFYGLRRSELLGLRWSAIDFDTGRISISTTVVKEKIDDQIKTVVRDGITKTECSQRTLPLCSYTYQYFVNHYHAQQYQKNLCGASYILTYQDFICIDAMRNVLQPDFVSQKFQKLLKQYGLRQIFPRSPSQLHNHYTVPGLLTERYSNLAWIQQLQFYCGYIPAHSTHSAPTDGEHLFRKVRGAFASTGHFAGRCVRKVLETQKQVAKKVKKYRIQTECGTFMVRPKGLEFGDRHFNGYYPCQNRLSLFETENFFCCIVPDSFICVFPLKGNKKGKPFAGHTHKDMMFSS